MTDATALQVLWRGQPVGFLTDLELETVDVFRAYKVLGRWVAGVGSEAEAFLASIAALGRLEVMVDISPVLGPGFEVGLEVFFSLASPAQAWLYVNDLEGRARLARVVAAAQTSHGCGVLTHVPPDSPSHDESNREDD